MPRNGEGGETADGVGRVHAADGQHAELGGRTGGGAAGTISEMALPANWAVITENHALVRSAMRWSEKVHAKCAPSATSAGMNQSRLRRDQLGPRVEHGDELG